MVSSEISQETLSGMNLTKRQFGITAVGAMLATTTLASGVESGPTCSTVNVPLAGAIDRLVRAYPDFLKGAEGNDLVWRDGTRMPIQLYPPSRPPAARLEQPDLAAQLARSYPPGDCALPVSPEDDPGRVRYAPFFSRMYGERQQDVEAMVVSVPWPGRRAGTTIRVTRVNGVADRLHAVSRELASLPRKLHHAFDNPAGGYYWRPIAGTNRLSAHSFGIAIDINVSESHYWRNELGGAGGEPPGWRPARARNRIPREIVSIFERHGFIWGGKWFHYDTMHFEYRPELLLT